VSPAKQKRRSARRPLRRATQRAARRSAIIFTRFILGLLVAPLALLLATPTNPPTSSDLLALFWLSKQRPLIILTAGALAAALILSALAWPVRGRHRTVIVIAWLAALAALVTLEGDRLLAWARLLIVVYA